MFTEAKLRSQLISSTIICVVGDYLLQLPLASLSPFIPTNILAFFVCLATDSAQETAT